PPLGDALRRGAPRSVPAARRRCRRVPRGAADPAARRGARDAGGPASALLRLPDPLSGEPHPGIPAWLGRDQSARLVLRAAAHRAAPRRRLRRGRPRHDPRVRRRVLRRALVLRAPVAAFRGLPVTLADVAAGAPGALSATREGDLIRLRGVSKDYPRISTGTDRLRTMAALLFRRRDIPHFRVLDDVDLDVRRGESLGVVGEN